jgi:nicotinate phosphoribosyltransferase
MNDDHNPSYTDAYKFAMASAGFPLRQETFHLTFRKGGPYYIDFDLQKYVEDMVASWGQVYEPNSPLGAMLTPAMQTALLRPCKILAAPKGSWVLAKEPVVTITGPSFLVSSLECAMIQLFHKIGVGTRQKLGLENKPFNADEYAETVRKQTHALLEVVPASRVFEVGLRAAANKKQHEICFQVLNQEYGITRTSHVGIALQKNLTPVGTMGHEHVMRWGNDVDAFRAMRDMRVRMPSYLLDTYDTITSGIPAAIKVGLETPHEFAIRYDSGDKFAQFMYAEGEFAKNGLTPIHIIEDGLTVEMVKKFETLRELMGVDPNRVHYGLGGYFVSHAWGDPVSRDGMGAVYKLSATSGEPRMKLGNEVGYGKASIPGVPVTWRRIRGEGPLSIIGQEGEKVHEDYICLQTHPDAVEYLTLLRVKVTGEKPFLSPETKRITQKLLDAKNLTVKDVFGE